MSIQEQFYKSIEDGDIENFNLLMNNKKVDPSDEDNYAIQVASLNGHVDIVKLLLKDKRVNLSVKNNYAIQASSLNGHVDIVKLLLKDKRVNPSVENNYAIRFASYNGHVDIVKLLLKDKRVDPSDNRNWAIQATYKKAYYKIFDSINNKNFNIFSFNNEYVNIIKLLWKDERVKSSLKNDDDELYDKLIKQDISDKIEEF